MQEFQGEIMSLPILAKYLGVSSRTVYRLCQKRTLPATKVGRSWRFQRKAIDEWLKWNRV